jgi:hypothetical protein
MKRPYRNSLAALIVIMPLLAACGNARPLVTKADQTLPPKPYAAKQIPDSTALLETSTQARPDRTVELRSRSELREDDEFNLPPE